MMVDFKKLILLVHRTHVLYRCNQCDREQWYVSKVPSDVANADKHWIVADGGGITRCRGRFILVKRRVVLRVLCTRIIERWENAP